MEERLIVEKGRLLLSIAEKMKGSYFFTPPSKAYDRRKYEEKYSIEKFEWDENGHHFTAEFNTRCSCKNIYAKGYYTKDNNRTNITAIRNSINRMEKAMKIYTACRETGDFIEECKSIEEAIDTIKLYEFEDKANDEFVEGFYDIVDENHCSIANL